MISFRTLTVLTLMICMAGRAGAAAEEELTAKRLKMVDEQIASRGVTDPEVLEAMRKVPRHLFVPVRARGAAYEDTPLPIGHGQTISQPYIVGYMTEALDLARGDRVLEIGTGSGYQAAVLAELAGKVYSIELIRPLAETARGRLDGLGYDNVEVRWGDGYAGWPDEAPFDAIIVTAAPPEVPEALLGQLREGGRMIVPVGRYFQELVLITRSKDGYSRRKLLPVRFVPMVNGKGGRREY